MWLLKSAKDRILGVDTSGQQVPPRVRYGMTYLLIRNTIGCVSCLDEWGNGMFFAWDPPSARGACGGNLSTTSRACGGNCSKA
jgi:hypothetical protein